MESIVSVDLVHCVVCFGEYGTSVSSQPKILPCGHRTCNECVPCLNAKCPKCRQTFNPADKLPTDHDLLHILHALKAAGLINVIEQAHKLPVEVEEEDHKFVQEIDAYFEQCEKALKERRELLKKEAKEKLKDNAGRELIFDEDPEVIGIMKSIGAIRDPFAVEIEGMKVKKDQKKDKKKKDKKLAVKKEKKEKAREPKKSKKLAEALDLEDIMALFETLNSTKSSNSDLGDVMYDLMNIISELTYEEMIKMLVPAGVIKSICNRLDSSDVDVIMQCLEILRHVLWAEKYECSKVMGTPHKFIELVEECGGLDKIETLQMHANQQVYEVSINILQNFFGDVEEIAASEDSHYQSHQTFQF
jgi:hypothetical protein